MNWRVLPLAELRKKAFAGVLCAASSASIWAQSSPVIDCSPNSVAQLNTGQPSASNAAVDRYWKFKALPAYTGSNPANWGSLGDATIVTSPTASWTSTPGGSASARWIGLDAYGNQPYFDGSNFGNIDAIFQVSFDIASNVSLASFQPSMTFSADNSVVDIFVNGHSQLARGAGTWGLPQAGGANQFNYNGFGNGRWLQIAMQSPDWQLGTNTMSVYVKSSPYAMGFGAAMGGTIACVPNNPPVATPVLSGPVQVGQSVTGTYGYADDESDPENATGTGTSYVLVRSSQPGLTSSAQGTSVQAGATGGAAGQVNYTLAAADVGQYLFYCVTPAASRGASPGVEACSTPLGPISNTVVPPEPQPVKQVPALSAWGLAFGTVMLGLLGVARTRRRNS